MWNRLENELVHKLSQTFWKASCIIIVLLPWQLINHSCTNNIHIALPAATNSKAAMPRYYALCSKLVSKNVMVDFSFSQCVQVIAVFTILAAYAALYYLWHNTHNGLSCAPNFSRLRIKRY